MKSGTATQSLPGMPYTDYESTYDAAYTQLFFIINVQGFLGVKVLDMLPPVSSSILTACALSYIAYSSLVHPPVNTPS